MSQLRDVPNLADSDVRTWMDAYKSAWVDRDPEQIVRLFAEDCYYRERRFRPAIVGLESLHKYWDLNVRGLRRDVAFDYDLLAVRNNKAFVHWQAHFTFVPIYGVMELDGISQIVYAPEAGPNGLIATGWDEWVESREA